MRYHLSPKGDFRKHLERLMRSINDDIALAMLKACRDPEKGVHEARKRCKEIRALLRFISPQIGETEFNRRQTFYRAIAAKLSGDRDAMVREQTWQNLVAGVPSLKSSSYEIVAQFLSSQRTSDSITEKGREYFLGVALDVEIESEAFENFNMPKSFPDLIPNLKRIYEDAQDAEQKAKASGSIEDFHRFRKRSKDLFYCMRVLDPMFDEGLKGKVGELAELTELQGLANDQAVLLTHISVHRQAIDLDDARHRHVQRHISDRLRELQKQSYKVSQEVFRNSPDSFLKAL